ncbi:pyridoxamine 5'-phosphate oxidase family protein [Dehalococcoidia bacterium]|nr:pyridoxamine 5'-phosphate oxidase family protein [Dehalococcoidia bacterium]
MATNGSDGWPNAVVTWAATNDVHVIRFGVDLGTATLKNIQRDGKVSLQIIGPDNVLFLVKGVARLVKDRLESIPPPHLMCMMEICLVTIKDQSWIGVVVSPLDYQWVGSHASEMAESEHTVLSEIRDWHSPVE